jgi:hypothetical protein
MIICPNCKHEEMDGAIYCSNCGDQLIDAQFITQKIHTAETSTVVENKADRLQPPPRVPLQSWISLLMIESGQILPLADRTEFTLGRSAEGQPIVPDVDLTAYNAYANGVSRLHAAIKLVNDRIVIVDLGSSNGTYLNGTRLSPYIEAQVSHGDYVYLGKLKIQILID